jgi:hypothetical protein
VRRFVQIVDMICSPAQLRKAHPPIVRTVVRRTLPDGLVNNVEDRVDGDMGYGGDHHHHRDEGLLGGLGELADDIGL